jgi:hypothetical protein
MLKLAALYFRFCVWLTQALMRAMMSPLLLLLGKANADGLMRAQMPFVLGKVNELKMAAVGKGMAREVLESERDHMAEAFAGIQLNEPPNPENAPSLLDSLSRSKGMGAHSTDLPTCGAALALFELRPDLISTPQFGPLYIQAQDICFKAERDRPGWNDFHMVQWFILRRDETVVELARRSRLPGMIGSSATWMMNSVSSQMPAFKTVVERICPEVLGGSGMAGDALSIPQDPGVVCQTRS